MLDQEGNMNTQPLIDFMQRYYTDERLAELLAHAEDGKLSYASCCCFIGIPTADHALQTEITGSGHYLKVRRTFDGAVDAEQAFLRLGHSDIDRRAALIPLIRAEMERRAQARDAVGEVWDTLTFVDTIEKVFA